MKQIILASLIAVAALPATAQMTDPPQEQPDPAPGRDLMEEGAKLLFRGLMSQAAPALRDLQDLADDVGPAMKMLREEMGPALAEIMANIDDISNYMPPKILPNGDIIIPRKPDAPRYVPQKNDAEVDL